MAKKWPEQRWRRKWSEIIDSLIESLIGQGHKPELGQEPPMAHMWPEQRWKRKWSEIIDSLIRNLIGQGHKPELGQEHRPWPTCGPSSAGDGNGPKSFIL